MQNYNQKIYKKNFYEINLIPLLDVLLILVLLLIATSSAIQNIEIDLPYTNKSKNINNNDNNSPVIIEVLKLNNYNLVVNHVRKEKISYEQMTLIIKSILNTDSNTVFIIGGDKDLLYKEIVKTLNILHNIGVKSVGLMTKNFIQ